MSILNSSEIMLDYFFFKHVNFRKGTADFCVFKKQNKTF